MLEVVLYRFDEDGRVTLREQGFASLQDLTAFNGSDESARWKWVEAEVFAELERLGTICCSTDPLRGIRNDRSEPEP